MTHLEAHAEQLRTDQAAAEAEHAAQELMQHEARERIAALKAARDEARARAKEGGSDENEVAVEYRH